MATKEVDAESAGNLLGIGAVCVPLFAASIEGHFTIPQLFLFCAVLAVGCALWYAVISFPAAKAGQAFSLHDILGRLPDMTESCCLPLFCFSFESGNEACIGGWTSTYVDSTGNSPRMATLVLAAYWGALMLSRMLAARVLWWLANRNSLWPRHLLLWWVAGSYCRRDRSDFCLPGQL